MRTTCASIITLALLLGSAIGATAQEEGAATDHAESLTGQAVSAMAMEAWATADEAKVEAIYDPDVIMIIDTDVLASDRDEIKSVIAGAKSAGNTYEQVGPVIEYEDEQGDLYVGSIIEVKGIGHPTGDPVIGFFRVRDGKVIRHAFMDAEHY